jgi:hypothetical protein
MREIYFAEMGAIPAQTTSQVASFNSGSGNNKWGLEMLIAQKACNEINDIG